MNRKRVMLINMPVSTRERPSIGLSLLKAALVRDGVACDVRYFNLRFADIIGEAYHDQIVDSISYPLLGEWIFAQELFGDRIPPPERYFAEVLDPTTAFSSYEATHIANQKEAILHIREQVGPFLDECLASADWTDYAIVGFTSVFQQNVASLALARRLKLQYPHLVIVFGGANCDGEMGPALHRMFPFVDYVCVGEADLNFPVLVKQVLAREAVGDIPGIVRRVEGKTVLPGQSGASVKDMDSLPYPIFDEYVAETRKYHFKKMDPYLFLETSRGCWWGEKSHCTFCGSNGSVMFFRSKSPDRAIAEIVYLTNNYEIKKIQTVDDIMDIRYFRDVLPKLKELNLPIELFYETKANLRKEQVYQFRDSGVLTIQPGIESLSTEILKLMRKGVTMLQNIQLLKWCAEYMIAPYWNVLAGFAGEDPAEYVRQAELVPLINHLPPPQPLRLVKLQRFAPMFFNSEQFGLRNVRAMKAYEYIYPFPIEDLNELAFQFDFEFGDGRKPLEYVEVLKEAVAAWASLDNNAVLSSCIQGDELVILDTRPVAQQGEYRFTGLRRAIYELCDSAHNVPDITKHLAASLPQEKVSDSIVEGILAEFMDAKLMVSESDRYLSLAVDLTFRQQLVADLVMSSMTYYSPD